MKTVDKFSPGYYLSLNIPGTKAPVFVENIVDYQNAVLRGESEGMVFYEDLSDGVHELDFRWGDQRASAYLLVKDGKKIDYVQGCGDRAPYVLVGDDECLAKGRLITTDTVQMIEEELRRDDKGFWDALYDLELDQEFTDLVRGTINNPARLTEIERLAQTCAAKAASDKRAREDKSGILWRLISRYRNHRNPLPTLRREKGGEWTFHREDPRTLLVGKNVTVYHGDNWWVAWCR